MAKNKCQTKDPSYYNRFVKFLKAPDELNANQEIESRDWNDWTLDGGSAAKISTKGSRIVNVASQDHGQVDAVIECPWGSTTRRISDSHSIRIKNYDNTFQYLAIINAVNEDFSNMEMRFICRQTTPNGDQDD